MSYLGETIKHRRKQRSMSLQDVANEAQISKAHTWDLERGKSRNPSVATLLGLAVALDLDPAALASLAFADLPGSAVSIRASIQEKPKGPAGDRGQVGWMGGEHDR